MSVKAMTAVWYESQAEGNDRLVLLAIADRAGDEGDNAWPTISELCQKTRLTANTIRSCNKRLMELGELEIEKNAGGLVGTRPDRRPNLYTVLLPGLRGADSEGRWPNGVQKSPNGVQKSPNGVQSEASRGADPLPKNEHIRPTYTSSYTAEFEKVKNEEAEKQAIEPDFEANVNNVRSLREQVKAVESETNRAETQVAPQGEESMETEAQGR